MGATDRSSRFWPKSASPLCVLPEKGQIHAPEPTNLQNFWISAQYRCPDNNNQSSGAPTAILRCPDSNTFCISAYRRSKKVRKIGLTVPYFVILMRFTPPSVHKSGFFWTDAPGRPATDSSLPCAGRSEFLLCTGSSEFPA